MSNIPTVVGGMLETNRGKVVELSSPQWLKWLETETNKSFRYEPSSEVKGFTVRVEQSGYWYGYRKIQGKLHKRYVGKPEELTQSRLEEIAQLLEQPPEPRKPKTSKQKSVESKQNNYATIDDLASLRVEVKALQEQLEVVLGKLTAR